MEATGSAAQPAETWTFVWSAPILALGIMVMVAAAVWWLRSTLGKSEVKGLMAQISVTRETAKTLEQRLSVAREQEQEIVAVRQKLEAQIAELQREVLFSPERVTGGCESSGQYRYRNENYTERIGEHTGPLVDGGR